MGVGIAGPGTESADVPRGWIELDWVSCGCGVEHVVLTQAASCCM